MDTCTMSAQGNGWLDIQQWGMFCTNSEKNSMPYNIITYVFPPLLLPGKTDAMKNVMEY